MVTRLVALIHKPENFWKDTYVMENKNSDDSIGGNVYSVKRGPIGKRLEVLMHNNGIVQYLEKMCNSFRSKAYCKNGPICIQMKFNIGRPI